MFIWLKLYYRAGIYIHPTLGLDFEKYLDKSYLLNVTTNNQIIFAEYDNEKRQRGIYQPERNFKTVKVAERYSESVRDIIKKMIVKEDWMDICESNRCIVVKDGLMYQKEPWFLWFVH